MSKEIDEMKKRGFAFCIHNSLSEHKRHYSKKSAKLSSRQIEQRSQEPEATMHQWAGLYQFIKLPHIAAANAKDKLLRKIDHRR